jgi:tetratricopeptide (TPR) repeat protein
LTAILSQVPQEKIQIARSQASGNDASIEFVTVAKTLADLAAGSKQDTIAALALIKEAEMIRTELHFRFGTINQQEFINQVTKAKAEYAKALNFLKRSPDPSLEAMARFGIGLCDEDMGNLEQARKVYQEVATDAAYQGTTSAFAAKQRLEIMNDFTQKIALKSQPKPPTPQVLPMQPATPMQEQPTLIMPQGNTPGPNSTP